MTIGCTRCGVTQEGEIILPQIAFKFPHKPGCGHGIGPLAKIPTSKKPKHTTDVKVSPSDEASKKIVTKTLEKLAQRVSPKGKNIDDSPKESKPKVEKTKVFGSED